VAGSIIYLEVDDEITSAAARIRAAEPTRLAVVLPHGSRVATSRINFRLLSRDALTHEKRLSLISADPATRALAASAGLPVFASVADYETAMSGADDGQPDRQAAVAPAPAGHPGPGEAPTAAVTAATIVTGGQTIRAPMPPAPDPGPSPYGVPVAAGVTRSPDRSVTPTATDGSFRAIRTSWFVGAAILGLALLVAVVGTYLLLPSATIVVTPRPEPVGPIEARVVADPSATEPGGDPPVIPAEVLTVPVEAEDTFPATGTRVDLTKAKGAVRFENLDPTSTNRIAEGSIVSTSDGIRFRTDATITVDRADLVGLTIFPARASVAVTAVAGGPEGNVEPGTIVVVPRDESSVFLRVTNPEATSGGTREEFARVTQEDIDAATTALDASLQAAFDQALEDPALTPAGERIFPETGMLGLSTLTVPADSLLGQEVSEFTLGATANGTVVSADPTPVTALAEDRLRAAVAPDHELVEDSVDIEIGDAVVLGQTVTFPVSATAEQIAILDADTLKAMVLGKPTDEAKVILTPFGVVSLEVSPDWSGSVPGFDSRVDLTIGGPVAVETAAPSSSP
jgi:Baseplate J-like protein